MLAMRQRVPRRAWDAVRALSILAAAALCVTLVVDPRSGLFVFWGLLIAVLPLVFLLAPGLWRNVCPLAAVHQLPRRFGRSRSLTLPPALQRHGYLIAVALFVGIAPARKVLFNSNGPAVAALLVGVLTAAFVSGAVFKGKSGWCSTFCPQHPVQRIYVQTPFAIVRNSHREP
jgi:polyferredoxin